MFKKIQLLLLKFKLRMYESEAKWYEERGCYDDWYHEHGIPNLKRDIKELEITIKNPQQRTFCYCPNEECNNELISSDSFVSDDEVVTYICTKCGTVSKWYFDAPCPILIKE